MAFSEVLKLQVKKKAMFRCCRCQNIGIDVHHILPQKDHGQDTLENAAPLCQNCHDQFGDNPIKRKEITQMRDHWYEIVEKMYPPTSFGEIKEINDKLDELIITQRKENISELRSMLKNLSNQAIDNMNVDTAQIIASNVVGSSSASLSNVRFEDLSKNKMIWCRDCGEPIWISKPSDLQCYHCGYFNSGED